METLKTLKTFIELLGNGAFPIVACGIMFWQNSELQKTITQVTNVLVELTTRISNIEDILEDKE